MEKRYVVEIIAGEEWRKIEIPFTDLSMARSTADSMMCALQESDCKIWSVSVRYELVGPEATDYADGEKVS